MTQAEIKKALEASVKDSYTAKTDDELRSQAEGMYKQQFENDLKALRKQTEQNVRAAYRDSLSAGMQRSSYVAAQQGLARSAGLEGQQQLQSNYESNLANAIASLRDKDQEQKQAADQYRNQLLLQLYNMGNSGGGGGSKRSGGTPNTPPLDDNTKDENTPDYSSLYDNPNYDPLQKNHIFRNGDKANAIPGDPGYGSWVDKNGKRHYYMQPGRKANAVSKDNRMRLRD